MSDLVDQMLSEGRYTITAEEAAQLTGWGNVWSGLARLQKAGLMFSPARGFYVAVPPEMRSWGTVPAEWYVDALMRHYRVPYYVGLLSAAAYHGASHQAAQVFQVVTATRLRDRQFGRVRLQFFSSRDLEKTPVERRTVQTGYVTVSTKEATLFDLAWKPNAGSGLNNIATITRELGELDGKALARLGRSRPRSQSRRVGWLVQRFGRATGLDSLVRVAAPLSGSATPLDRYAPIRGEVDRTWNLLVNTEVEPDL